MEASRLRIGDADRQAAADALAAHFVEGRLDADEHAERLDRIWTARTHADLVPLFADLPAPARSAAAGAVPAGRVAPERRGPRALPIVMVLLVLAVVLRAPVLLGVVALVMVFVLARRRRGPGHAGPPRSLRSRG